jgi:hypothetical protein
MTLVIVAGEIGVGAGSTIAFASALFWILTASFKLETGCAQALNLHAGRGWKRL